MLTRNPAPGCASSLRLRFQLDLHVARLCHVQTSFVVRRRWKLSHRRHNLMRYAKSHCAWPGALKQCTLELGQRKVYFAPKTSAFCVCRGFGVLCKSGYWLRSRYDDHRCRTDTLPFFAVPVTITAPWQSQSEAHTGLLCVGGRCSQTADRATQEAQEGVESAAAWAGDGADAHAGAAGGRAGAG